MKAHLMYRDRDFGATAPLPTGAPDLVQDLGLETLFTAMAREDKLIARVAPTAILEKLTSVETIVYRQEILRDCLANPALVRDMYSLATEANDQLNKHYFGSYLRSPDIVLHGAVEVLSLFVDILTRLRHMADESGGNFHSEGFKTFFAMIQRDLSDAYFAEIRSHLKRLRFGNGVLISARLGEANRGTDYCLRSPSGHHLNWFSALLTRRPLSFSFRLHPRDEAGARALSELRERGINDVANAAGQARDHIVDFLKMLQTELAFYVGCLNLCEQLDALGLVTCFPRPAGAAQRILDFEELSDICLGLGKSGEVVGNSLKASGKDLILVTGPNQGGKSTFVRSIGQAQLMMQAGMCVSARSFAADITLTLDTHYKREEDTSMASGKWDEELSRMSAIVDRVSSGGMVIFNESFQSTNEREGSSVARTIVSALLGHGVRVLFVTHMYDLAHSLYEHGDARMMFLRAERLENGQRTFRVSEGKPLSTSHGEDLYRQIFLGEQDGQEPVPAMLP